MSSRQKGRTPTRFLLTLRLRSRRSWASWRLSRTAVRLRREQQRTLLLRQSLDSSLLRQKELEQLQELHSHRLQEMAESRQFHQGPPLLEIPPAPSYQQLLGVNRPE